MRQKPTYEELEKEIEALKRQNELLQQKAELFDLSKNDPYQLLFENSLDGFSLCRMLFINQIPSDVLYIEANPAFERLTGKSNVAGKKASEIFKPIDFAKSEVFKACVQVVTTGENQKIEVYSPPLDRWLAISFTSLKNGYFFSIFDDISERKAIETNLLESKEEFKNFVIHSPDIIYKYSNKRGGLFWSDRVKDILGFSPEEIIENPFLWRKSIHPDDDLAVERAIQDYDKGQTYNIQYRIKTKEGKWIWLHDYFMDKKQIGDEIIIEGHASDITIEKNAEIALLENAVKFKTIFDISETGISITDEEGNVIDCNSSSEKMLGVTKEEHITRNYAGKEWKIVRTDSSPMPPEEFASVRAMKEHRSVCNVEMGIIKKDNEITWLSVSATPLDLKGYGVLITYVDITDQKNTEFALKESENHFKDLIEYLPIPIGIANNSGEVEMFNKCFTSTYGYQFNDVPDIESWMETAYPDEEYRNTVLQIWNKDVEIAIRNNELTPTREYRITDKSGKKRDVEITMHPVGNFFITSFIDITENKKVLSKLLASEKKLTELNDTKDKLLTIIGHDLKNPFNTILGFSELLRNNLHTFEKDKSENFLDIINSSAKSTLTLLGNLLDWAKTQTGQITFKPEMIRLFYIVEEIFDVTESMAKSKNIDLSYNFSENLYVYADKNMLKTILRNLISNAIKFTKVGGKVEILANKKSNYTEINVIDTGVGIKPAIKEKLFNSELNPASQGTAKEKGSGLGLILCKEFVYRHQGKIWVESELDKGSKFSFTLPSNL